MIKVTLSAVRDFDELGARWRALETRAEVSFFQSWTWMGCLPAERFPNPVLAEAWEDSETVGLALFNRRRRLGRATLYLGETGAQPRDRLFVEHNGPLAIAGREAELGSAMLRAAAAGNDLMLSGLNGAGVAAARQAGDVRVLRTLPESLVDLAEPDYLGRRSANTRQQIRRSDRAYAAAGPLSIARAATEADAHAWLEEMAVLHQATWTARGEPGCFADPFFGRFHHELIRRGMPRGEIDLLRVTAGAQVVGILHNFRFRGRALAYQSGFDYDDTDRRRKPGLTCHHLAIRSCAADGLACYDFLAGDDRYKRSLADREVPMHWIMTAPWWSPRLLAQRARGMAAGARQWVRDGRWGGG